VAGSRLNNLASLHQATNRLSEAEPLMRRCLEILLQFTAATSHEHPHLSAVVANYSVLLEEMGRSPAQIRAQVQELRSRAAAGRAKNIGQKITQDNFQI
jgi:hypothetical protein